MRSIAAALLVLVSALVLISVRTCSDATVVPRSDTTEATAAATTPAVSPDATAPERFASAAPSSPTAPDAIAAPVPTAVLQVRVRSERGNPVRDCRVAAGELELDTDAYGGARFSLSPGRTHVSVTPPAGSDLARQNGWQTVHADRVTEVVVVLQPVTVLPFWCRLVAAEDERPLAGVTVHSADGAQHWRSDTEGYVHLALHDATAFADVAVPGRSPRRIVAADGHATRATALRVPIALGATVLLQSVDPAGAPVGGVTVRVEAQAWTLQWPDGQGSRGPAQVWQATTDATGTARLVDVLRDRSLEVSIRAPAAFAAPEPTRWTFADVNETRLVTLLPGAGVQGLVLGTDDRPVADAEVQANRATAASPPRVLDVAPDVHRTRTDEGGAFRLDGLSPGSWWIGVNRSERLAPSVTVVTLAPGQRAEMNLRTGPGAVVAGTALDGDGRPCAGVVIDLQMDDQFVTATRTDAEGRFHFPALPRGTCDLTTDPYGGDLALPEPVTVTVGDEHVALRLQALRGSLAGCVDAPRAWVVLYQRAGFGMLGARCDLDGTFRHAGLDAGLWDVRAEDPHGRVAWQPAVVVVAGRCAGPLDLHLVPGALLRPRHPTADEFVVCRGDDVAAVDNLLDGASGEARVPPGAWTVVFRGRGKEVARREVTVAADDDVVVDGR